VKIRTKHGEECDLEKMRQHIIMAHPLPETSPGARTIMNGALYLLDALEAALSERSADDMIGREPRSTDPQWHQGWKGGWYAHGVAVRQAAGVVEENA
jgi:hypothetical protein